MLYDLTQVYAHQIDSFQLLLAVVSALLHIIFAGAVAKDAGELSKDGLKPILVSGLTWAFATLLGGVYIAALYWVIHHSKLTRA